MAKYIPSGNVRNRADINGEFDKIAEAINDQLDKKGGAGNQLEADLDDNGFKILNSPAPTNPTDLVRLQDLLDTTPNLQVRISTREERLNIVANTSQYTFPSDQELTGSFFFIRDAEELPSYTINYALNEYLSEYMSVILFSMTLISYTYFYIQSLRGIKPEYPNFYKPVIDAASFACNKKRFRDREKELYNN